jgi:hypothetical protein
MHYLKMWTCHIDVWYANFGPHSPITAPSCGKTIPTIIAMHDYCMTFKALLDTLK